MLQVDWKMLTPLRFVTLLTALVWPLTALPQTQAASAIVTIAPDPATLMVAPGQGSAAGQIHVTVAGAALSDITLYASPLTLGDQHAFVSFEASKTDTIRLDDSRLQCQANKDCTVHILVRDAWGSDVFQGKIDAFSAQGKVGSTPIASVRAGAAFQPVITSDALHDGRLIFDATSLPNVITWSDWVSAFLFGFGLDQLRDTVSTPANSTTTAGGHPPPTPAPAAAHTA